MTGERDTSETHSTPVVTLILVPVGTVFAPMGVRIRGRIVTVSYASYAASWCDIPLFDPSKGNRRTSTGNYEPRSTRRGSVALQRQRRSG